MESAEPSFKRPVRNYFEGRCGELAVTALQLYCNGTDREGQPLFTGSRFERFADGDHPDTFTTSDVVAVSMLSVNVPAPAAIQLLEDVKAGELLRKIGPDRPIWEVEEADLGEGSPASELWYHLQNLENVGPVTAGKLIAAKRPQLVPIYDQHVGRALSPPRGKFWVAMHRSMGDAHGAVESVIRSAGVDVTPLRGVDIVVWIHQYGWRFAGRALDEPPDAARAGSV